MVQKQEKTKLRKDTKKLKQEKKQLLGKYAKLDKDYKKRSQKLNYKLQCCVCY